MWLSKPQIDDVLAACITDPVPVKGQRDRVLLLIGFFTGLRIHELAKLRWEHVNLTSGTVSGLTGKRGKPIHIGLPSSIVEALRAWRMLAAESAGRLIVGTDPVIPRGREHFKGDASIRVRDYRLVWDQPRGVSGIYDVVKRRGEEAGVPALAPHDLRRSYAKYLEDAGVAIEHISKALRHDDISTTRRYLESNPERVAAIGQALKVDIA